MAYREFQYEKQYAIPDTDAAFAAQAQGISNLFRGIQQKRDERKKAADQFAYDLDKGEYENDTKILNELAQNVTQRARQELRQQGKLSIDTERLMKDGLSYQQMSKNQMAREKIIRQNIVDRGTRDPYYNAQGDLDRLQDAHKYEVDFRQRGKVLEDIENSVGDINSFKYDKYRADYVKNIGTQSKKREFPQKDGSSKTIYDQAVFWDESGKPGVTDQHAIRFLESDDRVAEYYDQRISKELDQEIKAMKASGDTRVSWMKDMSDLQIKNQLINDPSKNLINQQAYGARVRNTARKDLAEADRVNSDVSYTAVQRDLNNSGGRWKNQNVLHEDAINSFAQEAKTEDGKMVPVTTFGPGGRFTQKNGRSIQIDTTNPIRTDTRKGITTRNNKGSIKLNMTGYQLMPVRQGMAPFVLKSKDVDGMIKEISELPLEYFDPKGSMKLQPEMRIGLNGYTVNEAGVLNDINNQLFDLAGQMNEAQSKGDKEALISLQNMEYNLNELKEMVGAGDYDPQDLLIAGNKAGVRKIQNDMIIPADNSDLATIKNVTGGFDLNDQSYWSPEMKAVNEAYKKRAAEAGVSGYSSKLPTDKSNSGKTIDSDGSDVETWKRGAEYKVGNSVYFFDQKEQKWKKR